MTDRILRCAGTEAEFCLHGGIEVRLYAGQNRDIGGGLLWCGGVYRAAAIL